MPETVFTKIIKGEIPSFKVYEDNLTLAFLDIHPIQPGHTLVIPKVAVEFVWDLDKENYTALFNSVQKVALRLREVLKVNFVGSQIIGIDVPHAHVQLIPFNNVSEFKAPQDMANAYDSAKLKALAEKLAF